MARELETAHGDPEFQFSRLTVDMFRNAPFEPVQVSSVVVREGRRIRVTEATVTDERRGGRPGERGAAAPRRAAGRPRPDPDAGLGRTRPGHRAPLVLRVRRRPVPPPDVDPREEPAGRRRDALPLRPRRARRRHGQPAGPPQPRRARVHQRRLHAGAQPRPGRRTTSAWSPAATPATTASRPGTSRCTTPRARSASAWPSPSRTSGPSDRTRSTGPGGVRCVTVGAAAGASRAPAGVRGGTRHVRTLDQLPRRSAPDRRRPPLRPRPGDAGPHGHGRLRRHLDARRPRLRPVGHHQLVRGPRRPAAQRLGDARHPRPDRRRPAEPGSARGVADQHSCTASAALPEGARSRVTWCRTDPARLDPLLDAYAESIVPRLTDLPGFCSVSVLADLGRGHAARPR